VAKPGKLYLPAVQRWVADQKPGKLYLPAVQRWVADHQRPDSKFP
jgi:hypothetical protein